MPTTFNVISLGVLPDIDTIEGNSTSEGADNLVGMTLGSAGNALANNFVTMSPVGDPGSYYDMDNNPSEQFSINGGAPQTFDGTAIYNATITYIDGTTATITAVLFQDENGNTYLAPEYTANTDQAALEAGAIRSITLDSVSKNYYTGLTLDRQPWDNYVTCFVRGTKIETENGPVAIEDLQVGDPVRTVDNGLQSLRWIGRRKVVAENAFAPILIRKGALGNTEDLRVSPQHRILLSGWRAEVNLGMPEVLVPAKSLINGETILRETGGEVEYFHIMFDRHELVYAAGIQSESFHPGEMGWRALPDGSREEILSLFPELRDGGVKAYGATARPAIKSREVQFLS